MAERLPRLLGINIDHVATLRQVRDTDYPDLAEAVRQAEAGGADFITAHLREDRRHIQDADVPLIMEASTTWLNLEASLEPQMLAIACATRPKTVCLVPERRAELTTEGGLDVAGQASRVRSAVATLQSNGIGASLFVDPEPVQVQAAIASGAAAIELHTGAYAEAGGVAAARELDKLAAAVEQGLAGGLVVNMGHGITVANAGALAAIPWVHEYNIGHSVVARAVFIGLLAAVGEMREALSL